mmetsp:Transcript_29827/g.81848  ORF Transcript_29827/g.81848 Transcript_29827/m.81848 type:complete len:905 (+) Transcript_29827:122-2836(+)
MAAMRAEDPACAEDSAGDTPRAPPIQFPGCAASASSSLGSTRREAYSAGGMPSQDGTWSGLGRNLGLENIGLGPGWAPDSSRLGVVRGASTPRARLTAWESSALDGFHRRTLNCKALLEELCSESKQPSAPSQARAPLAHSVGQSTPHARERCGSSPGGDGGEHGRGSDRSGGGADHVDHAGDRASSIGDRARERFRLGRCSLRCGSYSQRHRIRAEGVQHGISRESQPCLSGRGSPQSQAQLTPRPVSTRGVTLAMVEKLQAKVDFLSEHLSPALASPHSDRTHASRLERCGSAPPRSSGLCGGGAGGHSKGPHGCERGTSFSTAVETTAGATTPPTSPDDAHCDADALARIDQTLQDLRKVMAQALPNAARAQTQQLTSHRAASSCTGASQRQPSSQQHPLRSRSRLTPPLTRSRPSLARVPSPALLCNASRSSSARCGGANARVRRASGSLGRRRPTWNRPGDAVAQSMDGAGRAVSANAHGGSGKPSHFTSGSYAALRERGSSRGSPQRCSTDAMSFDESHAAQPWSTPRVSPRRRWPEASSPGGGQSKLPWCTVVQPSAPRARRVPPLAEQISGFAPPPSPGGASVAAALLAEARDELQALAELASCAASTCHPCVPLVEALRNRALHELVGLEAEQAKLAAKGEASAAEETVLPHRILELRAASSKALTLLRSALGSNDELAAHVVAENTPAVAVSEFVVSHATQQEAVATPVAVQDPIATRHALPHVVHHEISPKAGGIADSFTRPWSMVHQDAPTAAVSAAAPAAFGQALPPQAAYGLCSALPPSSTATCWSPLAHIVLTPELGVERPIAASAFPLSTEHLSQHGRGELPPTRRPAELAESLGSVVADVRKALSRITLSQLPIGDVKTTAGGSSLASFASGEELPQSFEIPREQNV